VFGKLTQPFQIGEGMCGPTVMAFGSEEHKRHYLPRRGSAVLPMPVYWPWSSQCPPEWGLHSPRTTMMRTCRLIPKYCDVS